MNAKRQRVVEWSLRHCDLMQLRELYGLIVLGLPASLVQLCLFCFIIKAADILEVLMCWKTR